MTDAEYLRRIDAFLIEARPQMTELVALELAQPFAKITNLKGSVLRRDVHWSDEAVVP